MLCNISSARRWISLKKARLSVLFSGPPEGTLHLLSNSPPDCSPEFHQPPASKFGTSFLVPSLKRKQKNRQQPAFFVLVHPKGLSTCYRTVHRTVLPNFISRRLQNSEPRFSSLLLKENKKTGNSLLFCFGPPEGTRTPNLLNRNQMH